MFRQFVKGAAPALVCLVIAIFLLFNALTLVPFIAPVILIWALFALLRLIQETAKQSYRQSAEEWDRERFNFWLGAFLSCFVAFAAYLAVGVVAFKVYR